MQLIGPPLPLFFHQRTVDDPEAAPDEWVVDQIIKHRWRSDGKPEFLTVWKGFDVSAATWEPAGNFFHRYAFDIIKYCREQGIPLDVTKYLSAAPLVV